MIIYNNNSWGPEITHEEEENKSYEDIMKDIHSRIVSALNHNGENAHICDKKQ